jgi:hypothetical protein
MAARQHRPLINQVQPRRETLDDPLGLAPSDDLNFSLLRAGLHGGPRNSCTEACVRARFCGTVTALPIPPSPRGQVTFGVLVTAREILYLATTVRPAPAPSPPAHCSLPRAAPRRAGVFAQPLSPALRLFQQSGFELGLAKSERAVCRSVC